jgi:hypothetical protein
VPAVIDLMNTKNDYCLSMLQQQWLHARFKEGRNVTVVLGFPQGGMVFTSLEWEQQWRSDDREIESRLDLATWISMTTKGSYEAPTKRRKGVERCL